MADFLRDKALDLLVRDLNQSTRAAAEPSTSAARPEALATPPRRAAVREGEPQSSSAFCPTLPKPSATSSATLPLRVSGASAQPMISVRPSTTRARSSSQASIVSSGSQSPSGP